MMKNIFAGILEQLGKVGGIVGAGQIEKQNKLTIENEKLPESARIWNYANPDAAKDGRRPTLDELKEIEAIKSPYYVGAGGQKMKLQDPTPPNAGMANLALKQRYMQIKQRATMDPGSVSDADLAWANAYQDSNKTYE